jgi:hypothetical protein
MSQSPCTYKGSALLNVYVLLAPLIVTQYVSGSVPTCSFVAPVDCAGVSGKVIGIVVPHLLPPAVYTVTLSMPLPLALVCHVRLGRHWSRIWRATKVVARSSCLRVLKGQVVLRSLVRRANTGFQGRGKAYRRMISPETVLTHVMRREYWPFTPLTMVSGTSLTRRFAWWNIYL